ncbi:MAG TPA: hypothetical protein VFT47_21595 [Vicinamibacterales bacterium]|nr:hypothetical protein [Vicinamibacterales bacterium]
MIVPAPTVVKGEMRLTKDTVISGPRILLDAPRVVTNGFTFELSAETIEARGTTAIIAFEAAADRAPGSPGRGAGLIVIRAARTIGPPPSIDNSGEDGAPGARGPSGARGDAGKPGSQRRWEPLGGCVGGTNGSAGGVGGPGGDGGAGGAGGHGGIVLIDIREGWKPLAAQVVVNGGRGGRGGEPGPGGPGGVGGQAAPGIALCGGTDAGPAGPEGPPGRRGLDGPDGSPGTVRLRPKASS